MDRLQEEASRGDLTLERVFELLGEEGHAMLMLFLCLPFMQPIPIPGLSTPLGVMIALVAVFLFLNKPPWLPQRFEKLRISAELLLKISGVSERIWSHTSKVIKPRLVFFHDHWFFRVLNLSVFVLNALLLSLPLPIPFSNTIPVLAIVISAVGHMEKDGVFILGSYLWCILVGLFFATLAFGAGHLPLFN